MQISSTRAARSKTISYPCTVQFANYLPFSSIHYRNFLPLSSLARQPPIRIFTPTFIFVEESAEFLHRSACPRFISRNIVTQAILHFNRCGRRASFGRLRNPSALAVVSPRVVKRRNQKSPVDSILQAKSFERI